MPFDEKMRPDIAAVLDAAAILDITEYDLFRLAYKRWHGEVADEKTLEPIYVAYMFGSIVPVWVRHFARIVQRLNHSGRLDRAELGVEQLPRTREMVQRGTRFGVAIVTAMAVLFVLAEVSAQLLKLGEHCMFPPCY
jgi:hypothetical protein